MPRTITTLTTTISSRLSPSITLSLRQASTSSLRQVSSPVSHFPSDRAKYSTMSRTYSEALTLLSTLQSNKAITSLFSPPPASTSTSTSPPSTSTTTKNAAPKPNLNALAIPEMLTWLQRAGYTPLDLARLKTIHVAGTKGKGSVSALTTSILVRYPSVAGRVGTYTSPHVVSVRERIMLDGSPISRELFARYFFQLWDRFSVTDKGEKPFYFRFLTILAWHVFLAEGVRSAVVECGIGGEYDATNVLPAEAVTAAVITQLGIDHVAMLGGTAEEIAWHKAGILKRGVKGFTRRLDGKEGVMKVLRERAAEKGTVLVEVPDKKVDSWDGVEDAKLKGGFQKFNMALAVAAAREHLVRLGQTFEGPFAGEEYELKDMLQQFYEGLKEASLRGRCELIKDEEDGIEWYLDGAHTDESLEAAGNWFGHASGGDDARTILVFNQQERDAPHLLTVLLKALRVAHKDQFDLAIFCRNEVAPPNTGEPARDMSVQSANQRAFESWHQTQEHAPESEMAIRTTDSVMPALKAVFDTAEQAKTVGLPTKVLVTGSFHLVGAVIKIIEKVEE
ncbi:Mur ligase [Coniochaeta sp. 2T2.1]|nr:Mur ligase [Coniochaeta sp. 2T2.1]